jgi:type IV/VI secretion system ImpK/VasF family protein
MSGNRNQTGGSRVGMTELVAPVLTPILLMRSRSDYGDEDTVRTTLIRSLEDLERSGLAAGYTGAELAALRRPLVAIIDETVLNSRWEHGPHWSREPLGLKYFGVLHLGRIFFEEMTRLRSTGDAGRDLLEVYFLCLLLGFEGQYRDVDRERLRILKQEVGRELGYSQAVTKELRLSPNGRRRGEVAGWRQEFRFSWRVVGFAGLGSLVLLLALHLWLADIARRI